MLPKVSIIIPVYNVSEYIEQSLLSALGQTYENIEYIIVDDCGSDNSMEIVRNLKTQYPTKDIIILQHTQNKGLSAARNSGIEAATGEYLFFMDSDDTITENCIARHVAIMEEYHTDLTVGGTLVIGSSNSTSSVSNITHTRDPEHNLSCFFNGTLHVSAWNKLIRCSFLNKHHIRFTEGLLYEDVEWTFKIAQRLQSAVLFSDKTYHYFIRKNSITTSPISTKHIRSRTYLQNMLVEYIDHCQHERMANYAKQYLSEQIFKYATIIICSTLDFSTKKSYYKLLNAPKYRQYGKGIYSLFTALPFELFYSVFYLPRKGYSLLASKRNTA